MTALETAKAALEYAEQHPLKDRYRQWVRLNRLRTLIREEEKK